MSSLQWRTSGIALLLLLAACGGGTAVETPPEVLASITASPNDFAGSYELVEHNCLGSPLPSFRLENSSSQEWILIATSNAGAIQASDRFNGTGFQDLNNVWWIFFEKLQCFGTFLLTESVAQEVHDQSLLDARAGQLYGLCFDAKSADEKCDLLFHVTK